MAKKIRVLVADDHEAIRKGVGVFLEATKRFELVGEAAHGQECLELAERLHPDVVIMDITMPGIDGIKATKRLVSLVKGIQVIAHTCHDDVPNVFKMLNAGASAYVCKGEGWGGLLRAVDTIAEGRPYVSPGIGEMDIENRSATLDRVLSGPRHLTPRQLAVLRLLAQGKTNREMADELHISMCTIERHRENIRSRTGLKTVAELTRLAAEIGLV